MEIYAVLDVMHGQVVHAVAGNRARYAPVRSRLTDAAEPLAVASAFREQLGLTKLYVADLDAIAGKPPNVALLSELMSRGFELLADLGLRTAQDAAPLIALGVAGIVAGLETLDGPQVLGELLKAVGPARLVFSVDLKNSKPLGAPTWPQDARAIACLAIALGVQRLLILDLAHVGTDRGPGTEIICSQLKHTYPRLQVLTGGGVSNRQDLERLRHAGADATLVASALHDRRLTRADL
jgi:phosphoribosylformimino-5-aminoimidazole carboxamide ribotide isomerase